MRKFLIYQIFALVFISLSSNSFAIKQNQMVSDLIPAKFIDSSKVFSNKHKINRKPSSVYKSISSRYIVVFG